MKNIALIIGGLVLVAVLIVAAFIAGQMIMAPAETAANSAGSSGGRVMELVRNDGNGAVGVKISIEPAPELPDDPAEISGIFVRREDDSIFVGTGEIEVSVEVDKNTGQRSVATNHSGPVVEVVTTQETAIYKDVTNIEVEPSAQQSGEQKIQQVVQPDSSLAEVDENTELQVWGERRGDRVVADLVVYRPFNE